MVRCNAIDCTGVKYMFRKVTPGKSYITGSAIVDPAVPQFGIHRWCDVGHPSLLNLAHIAQHHMVLSALAVPSQVQHWVYCIFLHARNPYYHSSTILAGSGSIVLGKLVH